MAAEVALLRPEGRESRRYELVRKEVNCLIPVKIRDATGATVPGTPREGKTTSLFLISHTISASGQHASTGSQISEKRARESHPVAYELLILKEQQERGGGRASGTSLQGIGLSDDTLNKAFTARLTTVEQILVYNTDDRKSILTGMVGSAAADELLKVCRAVTNGEAPVTKATPVGKVSDHQQGAAMLRRAMNAQGGASAQSNDQAVIDDMQRNALVGPEVKDSGPMDIGAYNALSADEQAQVRRDIRKDIHDLNLGWTTGQLNTRGYDDLHAIYLSRVKPE